MAGGAEWLTEAWDALRSGRAAGLARDHDRLAALRAGLRGRVARAPLCDGDRLADELLAALRTAWRDWATAPDAP